MHLIISKCNVYLCQPCSFWKLTQGRRFFLHNLYVCVVRCFVALNALWGSRWTGGVVDSLSDKWARESQEMRTEWWGVIEEWERAWMKRACMNELQLGVGVGKRDGDGGWKVMDEPCMASVSGASLGSIWPRHGSKRSPGNREDEQGLKEGFGGKMIIQMVVGMGENGISGRWVREWGQIWIEWG